MSPTAMPGSVTLSGMMRRSRSMNESTRSTQDSRQNTKKGALTPNRTKKSTGRMPERISTAG